MFKRAFYSSLALLLVAPALLLLLGILAGIGGGAGVAKAEEGVGLEEELRNAARCAGFEFALEILHIVRPGQRRRRRRSHHDARRSRGDGGRVRAVVSLLLS